MSEPKNAYGISPFGHNPAPSGLDEDTTSETEIDEGEEQPLFWSDYYQCYVDQMTAKTVDDRIFDQRRSELDAEEANFRAQVGFRQTIEDD